MKSSMTAWTLAYYGECMRLHDGRVDLDLNSSEALACYLADPSRDPVEAALNDQGQALAALRPAWIDGFVMSLGKMFEEHRPGSVTPQQLAEHGASLWPLYWRMTSDEAADMEFERWAEDEERYAANRCS